MRVSGELGKQQARGAHQRIGFQDRTRVVERSERARECVAVVDEVVRLERAFDISHDRAEA